MLILRNCRFLRMAKTGTTYCTAAILASCPNSWELGTNEQYHWPSGKGPDMPAFGFVRHPLTWYESYWRHRMSHGWKDCEIDNTCRADTFSQFLENVLQKMEFGFVGRMFEGMFGKDYSDCQFIGRFEQLQDDLVAALLFFREDVCGKTLLNEHPRNVGDRTTFPSQKLPAPLAQQVVLAEKRTMFRFYAGCPILQAALQLEK
jgi:hypothetical protein